MMSHLHLTVSEFNQIMSDIIHNQLQLTQLCISGEITQFNYYGENKHLYLTLSHEGAHLQCVIYNQHLKKLPIIHKGDQCQIIGQCKFLKNKGQLIFSGVTIVMDGKGKKHPLFTERIQAFKSSGQLTKKTETDIPRIIEKVCIITSNQSAAHHDIKSILNKNPHAFESILIPSSVQGLLAPNELRQALTIAASLSPDLICISRGGGAEQDFDCFFDEHLANQLCELTIPVITGIGHEINTTLACLCANKHFETPTAMMQWLTNHSMAPIEALTDELNTIKYQLSHELSNLLQTVTHYQESATVQFKQNQKQLMTHLETLTTQIITLNPLSKLNNGFIYCETTNKVPLKAIQQLAKDDTIYITLENGKAQATITHVNQKENK